MGARYQIIQAESSFYSQLLSAENDDVIKPSGGCNQVATSIRSLQASASSLYDSASSGLHTCHYQILKAGVPALQETSRAADIGPKSYRQRPQVPSSMPHASRHPVFGAACWGRCAAPRRAVVPSGGTRPL